MSLDVNPTASTVAPRRASVTTGPSTHRLGWIIGTLVAVGGVAVGSNLTHDRLFHRDEKPAEAAKVAPAAGDEQKPTHDLKTTVVMPEGKFSKAGIKVDQVQSVDLPKEVTVAGKIEADPNRRVDVRAKASGVVRSVPMLPGTKVKKGDVLVVLDSPDVGAARLLLRERQRALSTVRIEAAWKAETAANTRLMIEQLRKGAKARDLIPQFANKPLGASRGTLIAAYTELEIAEHEQEKQSGLKAEGITGEHLLFVAEHTREGAQAKFEAALESVGFQVKQDDIVAKQQVRNAEEMVVDAAQRLRLLGVAEDLNELLAHPERASALPSGSEDLVAYPIIAPIDGVVSRTSAVISQKVETTDSLFVVSDLSKVYTVAFVHESNFSALPSFDGAKIHVNTQSLHNIEAKMLYAGSEVDPVTRSIRLVALTDNTSGQLVPNMFASIVLDTATSESALTVPKASVVEYEGKSAVFVPGEGERTFVIREVKLGREALGRQVVTEGLKPGDKVISTGAFLIKSELILQNEKEED